MIRILIASASVTAIAAMAVTSFLGFYFIRGNSMAPTLASGDIVACVEAEVYNHGDIVIHDDPADRVDYVIKRIVAIPQDDVAYVGKTLIVNEVVADKRERGYLSYDSASDILLEQKLFRRMFQIHEAFGPSMSGVTLNEISGYFVLGDSRDISTDSRHYGVVSANAIRCKVLGVVASGSDDGFHWSRVGRIR